MQKWYCVFRRNKPISCLHNEKSLKEFRRSVKGRLVVKEVVLSGSKNFRTIGYAIKLRRGWISGGRNAGHYIGKRPRYYSNIKGVKSALAHLDYEGIKVYCVNVLDHKGIDVGNSDGYYQRIQRCKDGPRLRLKLS